MGETQQDINGPTHFCLVGNISSALNALVSHYDVAFQQAREAICLPDLQLLLAVAFLPHVLLKFINNRILNNTIRRKHPLEFDETPYLMPLCKHVCQIGKLSLFVYFGEVFIVFLSGLGVEGLQDGPRLLASAVYSVYVAKNIAHGVSTLIKSACATTECVQMTLMIRVVYFVVYGIMGLLFLDTNDFDVGMAISSLLALGGVGSVVVGYALKDPMTEIVLGTNLLLNDKFRVGDVIRLPTGMSGSVCGKVQSVEWTDVVIQENDDSVVRISHSQLAKMRIVNISRMKKSQVSQKLTLSNKGQDKIEALLKLIKKEIKKSCTKLISPFRVSLADTTGTNVVISIETHHSIPRLSEEYNECRQNVLLAINRAILKYNEPPSEKEKPADDEDLSGPESVVTKKEIESMLSAFKEEQLRILDLMKQKRESPTSSNHETHGMSVSMMSPSTAGMSSPESMRGGTSTMTGNMSPLAIGSPSGAGIAGVVPAPPLYQQMRQQAPQQQPSPQRRLSQPMSPQLQANKSPPLSPEDNPFDMF